MISTDSLARSLLVLTIQGFKMVNLFAVLDPLIKNFIEVAIILGPLSIVCLILLLKKIEKDSPDRIRWK